MADDATIDLKSETDLRTLRKAVPEEEWRSKREGTRRALAIGILVIFGFALLGPLVWGLIGIASHTGSQSASYITTVLLPLLETLARFSAAVFGPLLAFILGYYFSGN